MWTVAYNKGKDAYNRGDLICPHTINSILWKAFYKGWHQAKLTSAIKH